MMETVKNKLGALLKILSGIIVLINFSVGIWAYPNLPDQVPSHWNAAGQIDGYMGPLGGAFLFPAILMGIYILFWIIPHIDPKRANYAQMGKVLWIVGFATILFMSIIYLGTIGVALGYLENLPRWYFSGIGILFIVLGNYFGKIKYNYTMGIRSPWTLASEEVWTKTHRFAGPIWIVGGVLMTLIGFVPAAWTASLIIGIIVLISGVPLGYSYWLYRKISSGK